MHWKKSQRTGCVGAPTVAGCAGCAAEVLHDGPSGKKKVAIQSAASSGWATSDDHCAKAGVYQVVTSCESQRRGSELSLANHILQNTKVEIWIFILLVSLTFNILELTHICQDCIVEFAPEPYLSL